MRLFCRLTDKRVRFKPAALLYENSALKSQNKLNRYILSLFYFNFNSFCKTCRSFNFFNAFKPFYIKLAAFYPVSFKTKSRPYYTSGLNYSLSSLSSATEATVKT